MDTSAKPTQNEIVDGKVFKISTTVFIIEFTAIIVACIVMLFFVKSDVTLSALLILLGLFLLIALAVRYIFTSITVGKNYVEFRKGWLFVSKKEIPYDNVHTVDTYVDIFGKIFNYGNIKIFTGNDVTGITFKAMDRPEELKELIEANIAAKDEDNKASHGAANSSDADELKKFSELHRQGVISKEEFDQKKKYLLDDDPNT